MKGLKKIALVTAITAISAGAHAELTALDDSVMGQMTGQAGLSIDLTADVKVGEVAYKDGGFITMEGIRVAGAGITQGVNQALDNITIDIDVAGVGGAGVSANYGIQGIVNQLVADYKAGESNNAATLTDVINSLTAAGDTTTATLLGAHAQVLANGGTNEITSMADLTSGEGVQDGDLVIHITATDTWDEANDAKQNVDFGFQLNKVALRPSTYAVGSGAAANTVLVSGINLAGYIGPVDVVIDESKSTLGVNAYFAVQGGNNVDGGALGAGEANAMTFDFMNVSIGSFAMNNKRGANAGQNLGYAHAAAVVSASTKGLMVDVKDFSADIDMKGITIGANSIGDVYITDLSVTATMDVYGH